MSEIPSLPHGCGSWVVTAPDGRRFELFDRANVRKAAKQGWVIETAVDYLERLNREVAKATPAAPKEPQS